VRYEIGVTSDFRSDLDLHRFPFDRQRLEVRVQSFLWRADEMVFVSDPEHIGFNPASTFEGLAVTGVAGAIQLREIAGWGEAYSEFAAVVDVRREAAFYVWTMFTPVILIFLIWCRLTLALSSCRKPERRRSGGCRQSALQRFVQVSPSEESKNTHGRVLPLVGELAAIMARRLEARRLDCPFIFHRNGAPLGDFRKPWKRACGEIGLGGRLIHGLRRSGVRHLIGAGVDPHTVIAFSGHRTPSMLRRYHILNVDDLRTAASKGSAYGGSSG
jgi:hypothetical protein